MLRPALVLPAGVACADFDLGLDFGPSKHTVMKEFKDKNGNVLRALEAGTGVAVTLTNMTTGEELSLKSNGAVSKTTFNADGLPVQTTGHRVIILFPTDIPAGPTSTLYVGRVTYTVDTNEVFQLTSSSGQTTDICAALAP